MTAANYDLDGSVEPPQSEATAASVCQGKMMLNNRFSLLRAVALASVSTIVIGHAHAQNAVGFDKPFHPRACTSHVTPALANVASDASIDPAIKNFLVQLDKNPSPFWKLPQPKPQDILTALQSQTPVDLTGVTVTQSSITADGHQAELFIMKPDHMAPHPGVILFVHGGVWIVGNFKNHEHLLHDLVVESGQPAVFVQYTTLPEAKYPVQMDQAYAALQWTAAHAADFGADPSRIAVVGNSVGGDMSAALTIMDKDRQGPKISYQVLLWPATDASVDTCSYLEYANGRFLSRDFMKYGWDLYAPSAAERDNPYVSPLRASLKELSGLPPALVITVENGPLRDEGQEYARRLTDAGVTTVSVQYNGTIHDFGLLTALADIPSTQAAMTQVADSIRAHIGR